MRDRELYEQILGIGRPWFVEEVELRLEQGEVLPPEKEVGTVHLLNDGFYGIYVELAHDRHP